MCASVHTLECNLDSSSNSLQIHTNSICALMAAGNVSRQEVWAFSGKIKDSFHFRDHQGSRLGTSCSLFCVSVVSQLEKKTDKLGAGARARDISRKSFISRHMVGFGRVWAVTWVGAMTEGFFTEFLDFNGHTFAFRDDAPCAQTALLYGACLYMWAVSDETSSG